MALNDNALVIPAVGYIYTTPPSTARPANRDNPAAPWVDNGHSSEDGLSITFEISTTKRRTWRRPRFDQPGKASSNASTRTPAADFGGPTCTLPSTSSNCRRTRNSRR
ncbi:hypothetical protein AB0M36_37365 [Actinoplanes sp. NPDC051346]|uniref:phage tail tube protein n=1 Tax=Actinoplanes sp. NPDC051346 TaxID=3155048 RepID=UPI00343A1DC3